MKPTVIITGFEAFGSNESNPTAELIKNYRIKNTKNNIEQLVLPVTYAKCFSVLNNYISEKQRENIKAIILLGLAENRTNVEIEKIAINWIDSRIPDNDQELITHQKIIPQGNDGIFSNFDQSKLNEMKNIGEQLDLPMAFSYSAGSYVCNFLYYQTLTHFNEIPTVFIHVPKNSIVPYQKMGEFLENVIDKCL